MLDNKDISKHLDFFNEEVINEKAKKCRFIKYKRIITGFNFLVTLVFYPLDKITLEGLREYFNNVSKKAIDKKFTKSGVKFMYDCLNLIMGKRFKKDKLNISILNNFKDVKIIDSTYIKLKKNFQELFSVGGGNGKSYSNLKIQFIYCFLSSVVKHIEITKGNLGDRAYSKEVIKLVNKNELFIADLGYIYFDIIDGINRKKGYFLGRLPNKELLEKQEVTLNNKIKTEYTPFRIEENEASFTANITEREFYYKKNSKSLKVRVIIFKNPSDVIAKRRRKLRNKVKNKDKNKEPGKKALTLCNWSIFITNADKEKLPAEMILNIYRIRWNIELIFKSWKSILKIHKSEVIKNPYRLKMEIYAKLIFAVFVFRIYHKAFFVLWQSLKEELSFYKVLNKFKKHIAILGLFIKNSINLFNDEVFNIINSAFEDCIKNYQKTKKTTIQLINQMIVTFD